MSICYAKPQIYFRYCQQKTLLMKQKRELYKFLHYTKEKIPEICIQIILDF